MERMTIKNIFVFLCAIVFSFHVSAFAADKGIFSTTPKTNNGKKWRIAYYQGGNYDNYSQTLLMTAKGLMELGWIENAEIPNMDAEHTKELWQFLANNLKSDYVQFVGDAYYSGEWDKKEGDNLRVKSQGAIINRVNNKKDIDFIFAAGTWAGLDLVNDKHKTPTMVVSVSDPVKAGIISSESDSGFDHIHVRVDPFRYERQVKIFHDIIGFKTLGMAYKDDFDGKSYAALDKVTAVSKERGFEIVSAQVDYTTIPIAEKDIIARFHELGKKKVDAIYVTLQNAVSQKTIPDLVKIANDYRIPTFSMAGSAEVRYGILLSISQAGFKYVGLFHAQVMAKIFNGAKPRDIDSLFEDPPKIAINLKSAEIIGFDPPVDLLGAADEIFQEIEVPK